MKATQFVTLKYSLFILISACSSQLIAGGQGRRNPSHEVTRGPYLQMLASDNITIRWRSKKNAVGTVKYGRSLDNLNLEQSGKKETTEHEIVLTKLSPNTKYFYTVGDIDESAHPKPDSEQSFVTAPDHSKATRVWVIGDAGTADKDQMKVRDAYYELEKNEGKPTDFWLMLGDNAYNTGRDSEYQKAVFDIYGDILKRSTVFSTRGNHEAAKGSNGQEIYYDIFTFPTKNELGGTPSGTEAYYSFNYGDIHFICLDSEGSSRSKNGAMAQWLKADLANVTQNWTIAFWHHPPYTKGSHDSDSESKLVEMRENFLPILESAGVDLVLSGHSHSYERSYFINGHYGNSSTFSNKHMVNSGGGRKEIDGAYQRSHDSKKGAVYTVAGSSGKISGGKLDHKAMFKSLNRLGSVVLDIDQKEINFRFLRENGIVDDQFTIQKASKKEKQPD